jgi:hypothetical protein
MVLSGKLLKIKSYLSFKALVGRIGPKWCIFLYGFSMTIFFFFSCVHGPMVMKKEIIEKYQYLKVLDHSWTIFWIIPKNTYFRDFVRTIPPFSAHYLRSKIVNLQRTISPYGAL